MPNLQFPISTSTYHAGEPFPDHSMGRCAGKHRDREIFRYRRALDNRCSAIEISVVSINLYYIHDSLPVARPKYQASSEQQYTQRAKRASGISAISRRPEKGVPNSPMTNPEGCTQTETRLETRTSLSPSPINLRLSSFIVRGPVRTSVSHPSLCRPKSRAWSADIASLPHVILIIPTLRSAACVEATSTADLSLIPRSRCCELIPLQALQRRILRQQCRR